MCMASKAGVVRALCLLLVTCLGLVVAEQDDTDHSLDLSAMQNYLYSLQDHGSGSPQAYLGPDLDSKGPMADEKAKRLDPSAFMGHRGKRLSASEFFGARGKKFGADSFYGVRGKKFNPAAFSISRGKKMDPYSFMGHRGKKSSNSDVDISSNDYATNQNLADHLAEMVEHFKSLRQRRLPDGGMLLKQKRQPPSGFHAVRG